jgi:hypothetical protein
MYSNQKHETENTELWHRTGGYKKGSRVSVPRGGWLRQRIRKATELLCKVWTGYDKSRHVKHFKIFAELISRHYWIGIYKPYQNLLLPLLKINVGESNDNTTKRQIDKTTNKLTLQNRNLKTLSKFATSFTKNKCWRKIRTV